MEDSTSSYEKNFKDWLKIADALMTEDVSGESRRIVTEQLTVLQKILQKKQREVEAKLEEDIQKEDAEIARLQESLHGVGGGQAEQTEAYDMMPLWYNLKMLEWQQIYDALRHETKDNEKTVLERLISILLVTFDRCREAVQVQLDELVFSAFFPGEITQNRDYKLPKQRDKDLDDYCTSCQVKTLQFCLPTIKQVLVESMLNDKTLKKLFASNSPTLRQAFKQYVEACIEFCWVACLEEEPVQLVTNPRKDCRPLLSQFNGEREVPNKSFVEWPAVVQNDVIRAAWQLFHKNKPRSKQVQDQQTEVVKQVQANIRKKEQDKVVVPRAVVYEYDDDWISAGGTTIGSESGSQIVSQSNSSINSRRSSGSSQVTFGLAQTVTAHGKPTRVVGSAQTNYTPQSSPAKHRESARAATGVSNQNMSPLRKNTSNSFPGESYQRQTYEYRNGESGGRKPARVGNLDF